MTQQESTPEPQWEECPYCQEYHPVGTSEQCPEKSAEDNDETSDLEMSADLFFSCLQADMQNSPGGEPEIVGIITDQDEAGNLLEMLLKQFPGGRKS